MCMFQCGKPYHQGDVIVLNGTEEDIERMRSRMEERKLHAKLQKVSGVLC